MLVPIHFGSSTPVIVDMRSLAAILKPLLSIYESIHLSISYSQHFSSLFLAILSMTKANPLLCRNIPEILQPLSCFLFLFFTNTSLSLNKLTTSTYYLRLYIAHSTETPCAHLIAACKHSFMQTWIYYTLFRQRSIWHDMGEFCFEVLTEFIKHV